MHRASHRMYNTSALYTSTKIHFKASFHMSVINAKVESYKLHKKYKNRIIARYRTGGLQWNT